MLDESTGVTPEVSATSAAEAPVVPQTTSAVEDSQSGGGKNLQAQVDGSAPPAAGDEIPENDDDLASLPETERNPLINQRNRIRELNKWRTGAEPVMSWVEERGGMEYVRQDAEMVDKLFSANVEDRQQFYASLSQDSSAFERILTDFVTDPMVQRRALENMDPQALLQYVEEAGLLPEGYGGNIDPAVLATIPQELQEVFRSLPVGVQEQYADMAPDLRNWQLRRDAQLYQGQKAERDRQQRERQQYQQQRAQQVNEQKTKIYNDVRSILQSSVAEKIPGSDEATNFILNATETAMLQDPECAALWNELSAHIEKGESRSVREKMPLMIAKAKSIAVKQATWLNERESKARQFDELMRLGTQEEIVRHLNQIRGGMKQPGPGETPKPSNTNVPSPEKVGQYAHENVLSYHPSHQRRS